MKAHSPVNFWLLVAATLAVAAVSVSWLSASQTGGSADSWVAFGVLFASVVPALVLYDAVATACVSVAVIWAAFASRSPAMRWTVIVVAVALAIAPLKALAIISAYSAAGYFAGQALLLALSLWIVRQFESFHGSDAPQSAAKWKYSLFDLLALMTGVAVTLGLLNRGEVLHGGWFKVFAPSILCNAGLAVAAVLLKVHQRALLNRIVILVTVALVSGAAMVFAPHRQADQEMAGNLIQAILLIAWIELAGIVTGVSQSTEPPTPTTPSDSPK